jgi:hypothetical protein
MAWNYINITPFWLFFDGLPKAVIFGRLEEIATVHLA